MMHVLDWRAMYGIRTEESIRNHRHGQDFRSTQLVVRFSSALNHSSKCSEALAASVTGTFQNWQSALLSARWALR